MYENYITVAQKLAQWGSQIIGTYVNVIFTSKYDISNSIVLFFPIPSPLSNSLIRFMYEGQDNDHLCWESHQSLKKDEEVTKIFRVVHECDIVVVLFQDLSRRLDEDLQIDNDFRYSPINIQNSSRFPRFFSALSLLCCLWHTLLVIFYFLVAKNSGGSSRNWFYVVFTNLLLWERF